MHVYTGDVQTTIWMKLCLSINLVINSAILFLIHKKTENERQKNIYIQIDKHTIFSHSLTHKTADITIKYNSNWVIDKVLSLKKARG